MRRPQRRAHLLMWLMIAPAVAAGFFLALKNAPADSRSDLDDALVTGAESAEGAR